MKFIKRFLRKFYDGNEAFLGHLSKQGAKVGKNVQIVDRFNFLYEPWYADQIELSDGVILSAGVRLVSHDSAYSNVFGDLPIKFGKIKIGKNTYVGVNSIILCGISIGENCIIGAGSVVNRDIPANSIAAGNPVRVISSISEGFEKYKKRILENSQPDVHYINFGGSYGQMKEMYGNDMTDKLLSIYHSYFASLANKNDSKKSE